jgi:hypothetical protein
MFMKGFGDRLREAFFPFSLASISGALAGANRVSAITEPAARWSKKGRR